MDDEVMKSKLTIPIGEYAIKMIQMSKIHKDKQID